MSQSITATLLNEGEIPYQDLQATEKTLALRGFCSDFCGAWLALWQVIRQEYGPQIESLLDEGESADAFFKKLERAYMAVVSAAVRSDKRKSRARRFDCSAAIMWTYVSGKPLPDGTKRGNPDRARVWDNYARYWRKDGWGVIRKFQRATHLAFVEREAREFKANARAHAAAALTDNLTDLITHTMQEAQLYGSRRSSSDPHSRPERFIKAVRVALDSFRSRFAPFAPEAGPDEEGTAGAAARRECIDFTKALKHIQAGVKIARARKAAGRLTRAEYDSLLMALAPLIELDASASKSANEIQDEAFVSLADFGADEDGESDADFDRADAPARSVEIGSADCDFPAKNGNGLPNCADKFIRLKTVQTTRPERAAGALATASALPFDVALDEFLSAFYGPHEDVRLRLFGPKDAPKGDARFSAKKILTSCEAIACDPALVEAWRELNHSRGIYFVVNAGGDRDPDITRINAFFAEIDDLPLSEQHARFDACPLPPSIRVQTLKSVHAYWLAAPGCSIEEWREIQARLIHFFESDPKIKNPARVMRLPGFYHVSLDGNGCISHAPVSVVAFDPLRRFTSAEMCAAFPAAPPRRPAPPAARVACDAASGLDGLKRELGRRIIEHESSTRNRAARWDCRGICHNGKGGKGMFYDPALNYVCCNSGCDLFKIARAFGIDVRAFGFSAGDTSAPLSPTASRAKERGKA
jgi:hypothetical protein